MKKMPFPKLSLLTLLPSLLIFTGLLVALYSNFPKRTITVIGEAKVTQVNKTATFSVGVSSVNDEKDKAVTEVNTKIKNIVEAIKNFGIESKNIKTQNASIYRMEQSFYEEGQQKSRPGQWSVSNNIEVKLVDKNQVQIEAFANMIASTEATNVNGPYFDNTDTSDEAKNILYREAINNAKEKAIEMTKNMDVEIGKVMHISEGLVSDARPFATKNSGMGGGDGTTIEPGTSTVTATVTVVYELKWNLANMLGLN